MEPIYRKVFIKSEADLPEEEGRYDTNKSSLNFLSAMIQSKNLNK